MPRFIVQMPRPLVSIVTPVLADAPAAAALLAQVPATCEIELILVDGGGDPALEAAARTRPGTRLLRTPPGRARQMNAGAAAATGDWLFFLHADSSLPDGWLEVFRRLDRSVAGGWFAFALDDEAWQARLVERLVAWRVRLLRLPYGDQGLFVRRAAFASMGGFRDMPLLEDVEFVRRLVRTGSVAEPPLPLRTSARRWRRDGWFRRSLGNVAIVALYFAGVPPTRLVRWYRSGRRG